MRPIHLLCGLAAILSAQPSSPPTTTGSIDTADGLKLFYRVDGEGRDAVVVLHGGPGLSMSYLANDLGELASARRVIYFDQRGAGRSTVTSDPALVSIAKHVEDLEAVRTHFKLARLTLFGHSWGAALAVRYAIAHPDRVSRLLLSDSMPVRRDPYLETFGYNLSAWMDQATAAKLTAARAARRGAVDPLAACRAYWSIWARGYFADPMHPPSSKADVCDNPPEGNANSGRVSALTLEPIGAWDWRADVGAIRAPTLVVHGDRDPIPLASARELAAAIPSARLLVIEQSGHFPWLDNPRAFFAAATTFLAGRWPGSAGPAPPPVLQTPPNDRRQPYRTTRDWGELPTGVKWAAVTAVEPAPDGSIFVIHRCFANSCAGRDEAPILKYDASGKLLAQWGAGLFVFPHGATVDRDGNLWVTDARGDSGKGHQVLKFDRSGQVVMRLGTAGVAGGGHDLFDQPTDVVVSPATGDIFVTDGHRNGKNNRVVHFAKDGTYIKEWGSKGTKAGEMSEPHTIAMDSRGRLFVGDRENNRILIFDQHGRQLDEWRQFGRPSGIFITPDDTIYVADSESGPDTGAHELIGIKKGIRIGSAKDGHVAEFIEDMESTAPDHSGAEGVGVDARGNVYGAVVRRQMLERHVRR